MKEIMTAGEKLLSLIAKGLHEHANKSTANQLGDRSSYIGMSDIALMQECPRLATLRKVNPLHDKVVTTQNYTQILQRQLTLQRGHWLEDGIAGALYANGFKLIPQLELSLMLGNKQDIPVKVHFDFILVGENSIRVLELKSTANIPKTASTIHETQIQGQVSLLSKYAHLPVFNLRDAHGTLLYEDKTFKEICKAYLGVTLSKMENLQGWILCVSMDEARTFGAYLPNKYSDDLCERSCVGLWKYMENYQKDSHCSIPHAKGFCILCSFCEYVKSCPKFDGIAQPEWEQTLEKLEFLKVLRDNTNEEIKLVEDNIKQTLFPTDFKGKWIEAGQHRFRVTEQAGRKSLDKNMLIAELAPIMGESETLKLLENCEIEGAPFARLYTQKIKD